MCKTLKKSTIFSFLVFIFALFSPTELGRCFEPSQWGSAVRVYVEPSTCVVVLYTTFKVNVSISDVVSEGLFNYEFRLNYNNSLLNGVNIVFPEDHFLKPQDPANLFIVERSFNQIEGYALVAVTLLGLEECKFGSGTLVTVIFHCRDMGSVELNFSDCHLAGLSSQPFSNVTLVGGVVNIVLPDFDGDIDVDASDMLIVCQAFGSHVGDEKWKPSCDVNKDLLINILDVAVTAKSYGRSATKQS